MPTDTQAKPASETPNEQANPSNESNAKKEKEVSFGNGRFSAQMAKLYEDFQKRFGIPADKAEKIARQAGSDAGAALRNSVAKFKVGKANSEGQTSIKDIAEAVKGISQTFPLKLVHSLQWIEEAGKHGISYGNTAWKLDAASQKWVDELEVK